MDQITDFDYFVKHADAYYQVFGNKCVAIQNRQVIGFGDDCALLWMKMVGEGYQPGTFIVQRCGQDSSSFTQTPSRYAR